MILYDQTRGNMGPPSNHCDPLARGKPIHVGCWRNRRRHIIHLLWPEPRYFFWFLTVSLCTAGMVRRGHHIQLFHGKLV